MPKKQEEGQIARERELRGREGEEIGEEEKKAWQSRHNRKNWDKDKEKSDRGQTLCPSTTPQQATTQVQDEAHHKEENDSQEFH